MPNMIKINKYLFLKNEVSQAESFESLKRNERIMEERHQPSSNHKEKRTKKVGNI